MAWQIGESGNPGGRMKNPLPDYIRELTGNGRLIVEKVMRIMNHTKKETIAIWCAEFLADRCWGKPTQSIEHSGMIERRMVVLPDSQAVIDVKADRDTKAA